jgi:hypothetical protein
MRAIRRDVVINTLAAMHAAARARKKQAVGAKAAVVAIGKRRRPSVTADKPHASSSRHSEKIDD